MRKRILIFSLAYYPHVGGAEIAIKEITDRLGDIEFHMITMRFSPAEKKQERIGNMVVHRVGKGSSYLSKVLFVARAAFAGRRLCREERFDGAWAMMSYMTLSIVLLRLLGVRLPYALTLQEGDPFERVFERWYIRVFSPLLNSGFRRADVVQAISTFLGAWARKRGFTGRLEIIPNGVNLQHFLPERRAHQGIVLITTSRLVHKNAVDDIIRALPLLPEDVRFLVLGIGQDEPRLKELAQRLGVADRVQWLGQVSYREVPNYLNESDIFVRPSRSEGMGNSFIEAMAAGLPVIATQEGGIADFLFDTARNPDKEPTGWAVDKNSSQQIAKAVKAILNDPAAAARVVANARRLVEEKYDWNEVARAMQERVFSRLFA